MKKKFLFGMIALLSISLFFLGCPTEADDDTVTTPGYVPPDGNGTGSPSTPQQGAKTIKDLLAGLGFITTSTTNNGVEIITITGVGTSGGIISQSISISAGVRLVVDTIGISASSPINVGSGGTIEVTTGNDLTVYNLVSSGNLDIDGTVNVAGAVTVANVDLDNGTLIVDATGRLTVNGTLDLLDGVLTLNGPLDLNGVLDFTDSVGATLDGVGPLTINDRPGAILYVADDLVLDAATTIVNNGTINVSAKLDNTTNTATFSNGASGKIIANGASAELDLAFTNEGTILVPTAADVLTISGTTAIENEGTIIIGDGGTLDLSGGTFENIVGGTIYIAYGGTLENTGGTFTHTAGTINVNGIYTPDADAVDGGQVNVGSGGVATYTATTVGDFDGPGIINVASDGSVFTDGGSTLFIGSGADIFDLSNGGSISYSATGIGVGGAVTLADGYGLLANQVMEIKAGGVLTIADSKVLAVTTATSSVKGIADSVSPSQIVIGGTGAAVAHTATGVKNFYVVGTPGAEDGTATYTYTWNDTDANGSTAAGTPAGWSRP
jgi:hypothetical protein